jgi:pyruvate/2-oxoglutarate dehydrogenase complex dihydrolipoamide acyltransferase (E2) component
VSKHFGTYNLSALTWEDIGGVAFTPLTTSTTFYPGTVCEKPVVRDGEVVIRRMMLFGIAVDHFAVDGLQGYRAAARLKELVERPELVLGDGA